MKILYVAPHYHPFVGGLETQLRLMAKKMSVHHEVVVAVASLRGNESNPSDLLWETSCSDFLDEGVQVRALNAHIFEKLLIFVLNAHLKYRMRRNGWERRELLKGFYEKIYFRRLRRLSHGKDIIHCMQGGELARAAERAARKNNIPFFLTPYVHPGQYGDTESDVALYKHCDVLFALLETDKKVLLSMGVGADRVRLAGVVPVLPSTVDAGAFRSRHALGKDPLVLFVGRMEAYKGCLAVRDSIALVWKHLPNVRFVFIGPAGEDTFLMQKFHSLAGPQVIYLGKVSEQEKGDAFAACDLFCMPSRHEILPATYLEAWSCGKAVIGGTAPGLAELIEGNDAGYVRDQDPALLADCIVGLLRDHERRMRMGENGLALIHQRFSETAVAKKFEDSYFEEYLAKRNRVPDKR